MKRCKYIVLIAIMLQLIVISSCGKNNNTNTNDISDNVLNSENTCSQSGYFAANRAIAESEDGYYIENGYYISYVSKNTKKEIYLCGKPECNHTDENSNLLETCDSYIGTAMPSSIVYYDNHIYILEYDENSYNVTLVKISSDGSVHEDIAIVGQAPDQSSYYSYVISNNNVYIAYTPGSDGKERTASIKKLSLDTKEMTVIYSCEGINAYANTLKIYDGKLYFRQGEKKDGESISQLVQYDLATSASTTIIDKRVISYTIDYTDNMLVYFVPQEGVFTYDLNTFQSEMIRACDEDTMYAYIAYDGTYLYLDNLYNEGSEHKMLVLTIDGSTIHTIDMPNLTIIKYCGTDMLIANYMTSDSEKLVYINKDNIDTVTEWSDLK